MGYLPYAQAVVDALGIEREHSVDWTKRSEVATVSDSRKKTYTSSHSHIQSSVSKQPAAERDRKKQAEMGAGKTAKRGGCMVTAHRDPAFSTRLAQVRCSVDEGRPGRVISSHHRGGTHLLN